MGLLVMVGQVLLALSILIVLHELGHFLAARAFGIKVEKFYLFFDAWNIKLFKINYKGCEYGIGWLPLGGYVKIAGMIDESMDTEQMKGEPQPWEFRSKPAWQRLIVMLGGIIVNVVVGILIFWMITYNYGSTDIDNTKLEYGVAPGPIGKEVGIQPGDRILSVDGDPVKYFGKDIMNTKVLFGDAVLTIERDGKTFDLKLPPNIGNLVSEYKATGFVSVRTKLNRVDTIMPGSSAEAMGLAKGDIILFTNGNSTEFFDQFKEALAANAGKSIDLTVLRGADTVILQGDVAKEGTLGVSFSPNLDLPIIQQKYSLAESLPIGTSKAFSVITDNVKGFGKIFKGELRADKALSGPVGLAQLFGSEVDWLRFWGLVGLISMALAFMNLLPIPALDGGHVLFLLIEIIQGKPLSDKFLERAQVVGFFLIIGLMIFVFGNDIFKLIK